MRNPAPSSSYTSDSTASPPTSPGTTRSVFPSPPQDSRTTAAAVPRIVTTSASEEHPSQPSGKTYYNSDSSGAATPEQRSPGPVPSPLSQRFPNEARSVSDSVVAPRSLGGFSVGQSSIMAGPSSVRADLGKGAPRNSSMDSAISAISSRSNPNKASQENGPGTTDIAHLIKTAGSAEAVIQYLLKEKQSQSQQNAQLWRLVDKQRAMILGLNKDLERALKDKEKYRKKLKEVMSDVEVPPVPPVPVPRANGAINNGPGAASSLPKEQVVEKQSPVDVEMAPYPITPPADQPTSNSNNSDSFAAVGELLDPSHSMPKASEHAFDQFDPDQQEREAEAVQKRDDEAKDLHHVNVALPPSRAAPREPPKMPPPRLPAAPLERSPKLDEGIAHFPPPPAPPPRKPPPAPLHLKNVQQSPTIPLDEDLDSDTDYDDILEVDEIGRDDRRGRRRTREEDEREREIVVQKEAEIRSLSKKSKSSSRKGIPKEDVQPTINDPIPASPRLVKTTMSLPHREHVSSLAGVLSGAPQDRSIGMGLLSPGLPSSPRPMNLKSPVSSPPLSPLGMANFPGAPLSPRPPRGPIPLPPNTPLQTPYLAPDAAPLSLKSPKPLNIVKKGQESASPSSPVKSSPDLRADRRRIYKGLVTEEYPDLLLPPNALPSIDIKVASSRMKPSRASLISLTQLEEDPVFTLAIFSRADGGELWRVEKDSPSLAKLDQRLKQCPAFTAKTPDRSLFSGHAPAKLDARRVALNYYLDELLNTPYLSTNTLPPNADETGGSTADIPEESAQKTGPGGRPFRTGYLTKRGKNFGGWKARFFVLDGPQLKYYETPAQIGKQSQHNNDGSPARGSGPDETDNQYRHAFLILEPKKKDPNSLTKHVLCAESDRERDQWVDTLLRWIDYRDPEEEERYRKEQTHDRNGSAASERVNGANLKKQPGQGKQQPVGGEENLISVNYEATRQGDIPQGAPPKGRQQNHDTLQGHTMSSQPIYTISAPRDPQVITNSEPAGSKLGMALSPPNQEEKKARKRSFFGFGPKTRSPSDGQDSLYGDNNSSMNGQTSMYGGPVRQVFGATLAEAVRYNSPVDVRFLDAKNAFYEEGIFRLSGSNLVIKQLKERFNVEGDINLLTDEQYHDIHAVASLLKAYFRELPTTILTSDLRMEFIAVTEMSNQKEKLAALSQLVQRLPQANATILNHSDVNKMTVRNVGIVFSPTLNIPAPVFALFLQNFQAVWNVDPAEYEPPILDADGNERSSMRPSDGRPSTSHSDSPHRQRMMEAVLEGHSNRNTPTPPPILSMQQVAQMNAATLQSRSSPTPPPQRPTYEPQYAGQQRPAYETSFVQPSHDSSHLQAPTGANSTGLSPAPYDQPYKSRRPGSASSSLFPQTPNASTSTPPTADDYHSPSPGADGTPGDPKGDAKKPRSCESCRGLKVRCEPDPANLDGPCKRCAKANRACVVTQPTRKRQKKTDSRVAELEKKIDALTASLQATRGGTANSIQATPPQPTPAGSGSVVPASGSVSRTGSRVGATLLGRDESVPASGASRGTGFHSPSTVTSSSSHQLSAPSRPPATAAPPAVAGQKRKLADTRDVAAAESAREAPPATPQPRPEEVPDIIDQGIITLAEAGEFLERYTDRMSPHMPGIVFPAGTTVDDLRAARPVLFLAIMTAASNERPNLQRVLTKQLMQVLADKIVVVGEKRLELVQALQVSVIWYWPPERFEELKFYQLVHMAAVMAMDIGLGRKKQAKAGFRKHILQSWRDHPFRKLTPPDPTTIEARRAWLTCFFLSASTSMALHRPNLIRWSPFMTECVDVLESSPLAAPTDKYLCQLVWTHRLAEEVGIHFSMDDPMTTPNIADSRTQYALRGFERELDKFRTSTPQELRQRNLYMHELATQNEFGDEGKMIPTNENQDALDIPLTPAHISALSACLTAIDGIFEIFLSLEVEAIRCLPIFYLVRVAYATVVLIKIYFAASSPKSELGKVIDKDNMKVEQHLDNLREKFRAAATDEKSRPASKFLIVLVMLRSWFQSQKQSQNQNPGAPLTGPPPCLKETGQRTDREGPQQPDYSTTANTPLQLLSEVATGQNSANVNAAAAANSMLRPNGTNVLDMLSSVPNTTGAGGTSGNSSASWYGNARPPPYMPYGSTPASDSTAGDTSGGGGGAGGNSGTNVFNGQFPAPWLNNAFSADFDYSMLGDGFAHAMDLTLGGFGDGSSAMEESVLYVMQEPPWFMPPAAASSAAAGTGVNGSVGNVIASGFDF
ncbi:hypothetical protein B0T26DRAFT_736788 [Lasiosphaeria miniovina]|uniref:RhoGAP-domain-containing protein n=1 Tax=Lasiosphaeria miniovina TaxID=1954250 RepID=A0AA40BGT8_9PEZI|nr:uncharacterized protein B0T26DRAFT_736788 [Lasiosphaeria miniovina]KAK0733980.1 hypothetical protein B0T26DRAFT_736788 [Lasiosphaeria miniovina]